MRCSRGNGRSPQGILAGTTTSFGWLPASRFKRWRGNRAATSETRAQAPSGQRTLSLAFNKSGTQPVAIVAGPDGNIWFVEASTGVIPRLTL